MIISLRKWRGRIKFLVMFVILVYVFFHMLQFVYDWIRRSIMKTGRMGMQSKYLSNCMKVMGK